MADNEQGQLADREVVDAARAVRDVAHDDDVDVRKLAQHVRDGTGEHEEALGKLQGHLAHAELPDAPHRLDNLKVVVARQLHA